MQNIRTITCRFDNGRITEAAAISERTGRTIAERAREPSPVVLRSPFIRTPSNIRSGQFWTKSQPTVEDAPDGTDSATPDYSYANDDNFRNSVIESTIDESLGFLQDTSSGIEDIPPSDKKSMNLEQNQSTSVSASSPHNDQYELPHEENADRSPASSVCEISQMLHHKRKFSAIESDSVQSSRKRKLAKPQPQKEHYHVPRKALLISKQGLFPSQKDKWKGHFCHPSPSDLSADKKDEIERKCNCILRPDQPDFLEEHTKPWKSSGFWHSSSLDVSRYPCYTPTREVLQSGDMLRRCRQTRRHTISNRGSRTLCSTWSTFENLIVKKRPGTQTKLASPSMSTSSLVSVDGGVDAT